MKLVCIDNKQIPSRLTFGKEYEVMNSYQGYVWVISDDGITRAYLARRFALKSDLRDAAISKIGI
jgi:hypothetical protein